MLPKAIALLPQMPKSQATFSAEPRGWVLRWVQREPAFGRAQEAARVQRQIGAQLYQEGTTGFWRWGNQSWQSSESSNTPPTPATLRPENEGKCLITGKEN